MMTESTNIEMPISFTPEAVNELKRIIANDSLNEKPFLRIGVKGGGCSGLSYQVGFDNINENDERYSIDDIPVVINPIHKMYLVNMIIDYKSGLDGRGFTFINPNASSTCGCGESFAV